MDPDANLTEQLRLAAKLIYQFESGKPISEHDTARLAELAIALHEWITKGGFLPKAWKAP